MSGFCAEPRGHRRFWERGGCPVCAASHPVKRKKKPRIKKEEPKRGKLDLSAPSKVSEIWKKASS